MTVRVLARESGVFSSTFPHPMDHRFRVKFGQLKPSFGRQEMTSSGSQIFVDRSNSAE